MPLNVPAQLLEQLPLLAVFIVPITTAYLGIRVVKMKSVIHFQQGTKRSSAWRAAAAMSILTTPSFAFWCLLVRGASALLYQLGFSLAIALVFSSVAGILHYIPSPSLFTYMRLRFLSNKLRLVQSLLQTVVTTICIVLVLLHSSSLLFSISVFSLYLCIALMAFFPLFGIVFTGYSSITSFALLLNVVCILFGIGTLLIFGLKDAIFFRSLIPFELSISDSAVSLCIGFVVSLYHLTSSPLLYQAYFPVPTLYKLRLTLALYGVFQLFLSVVIYLAFSLFFAFMEKRCKLPYSFKTFFQFVKLTVPHPALAYASMVSVLSVFMFTLQWLYICITTHIWEEFIKSLLLMTCAVSVSMVSAIRFVNFPYELYTSFVVIAILTVCGSMCGVFVCGYVFPFCNSKGALAALVITTASSVGLFYLFVSHNQLLVLKNSCTVDAIANTTVHIRSFNMEKVMLMASYIPLQAQPIIAFVMCMVLCPIISLLTGGQDQMSLDWNLVVKPCFGSFEGRAHYSKRPFVDSESFRQAQLTKERSLPRRQR